MRDFRATRASNLHNRNLWARRHGYDQVRSYWCRPPEWHVRFILLIFLLGWLQAIPSAAQTIDFTVVFRNVSIVPMDSERVLPNRPVVVKRGKITAIGEAHKTAIPPNAVVIDGSGRYLLPGLADMHVHTEPQRLRTLLGKWCNDHSGNEW
jgi:hypothetical protein